jgi:N-acetylglucosaminyl-diphospho-decaprenol L-rhamnosyltransferase
VLVSVIIIHYNSPITLKKTLLSVCEADPSKKEIIVVDDCSNYDPAVMVRNISPKIKFVRNARNYGPTKSRNIGAKFARGNFLVFLDSDIIPGKKCLVRLIKFLERFPNIGAICPSVLRKKERIWWNFGYDPNNFRESIGYICGGVVKLFPKTLWLRAIAGRFIMHYRDFKLPQKVSWVIESIFATRKESFEKIGGFDERFFMFFEGPDYCRRLRRRGLSIVFYPGAYAIDLGGHSQPAKRKYLFIEAKQKFYQKHYYPWKSNPLLFWLGNKISSFLYKMSLPKEKENLS